MQHKYRQINKIIFVRFPKTVYKNHHPVEAVWPFSIGISATILRELEFSVRIIDFQIGEYDSIEYIIKDIVSEDVDVLFIQYDTISVCQSSNFSCRIKAINKEITIIGFGQHASFLPREVIEKHGADICIMTDLEFVVRELICALKNNTLTDVKNIAYRNNEKVIIENRSILNYNLDSLPFIDLSLLDIVKYKRKKFPKPIFWGRNWGFIRTSLGCPYHCVFCSPLLRHSIDKTYRLHSIDYVIRQIRYYKDRFGVVTFSMEDDIFSVNEDRTKYLCDALATLKIKWVVDGARVDTLSEVLLRRMKKAGCYGVGVGIESGSQSVLDGLGKRQLKNNIKECALNIKRMGMLLVGYIMIGVPNETEKDLKDTIQFADEIRPHILYVHYFMPYPGSEAYKMYKDKINITHMTHYGYCGVNFSNIEESVLRKCMKNLYRHYYISFKYVKEYIRGRLRYAIFDLNELTLIKDAFTFIIRKRSADEIKNEATQ